MGNSLDKSIKTFVAQPSITEELLSSLLSATGDQIKILNRSQVICIIEGLFGLDKQQSLETKDIVNRFIKALEKGNSAIEIRTLISSLETLKSGQVEDKLKTLFDLYDVEQKGLLNREELFNLVALLYYNKFTQEFFGFNIDEQALSVSQYGETFFVLADKDGSGTVDLNEFLEMATSDMTYKNREEIDTVSGENNSSYSPVPTRPKYSKEDRLIPELLERAELDDAEAMVNLAMLYRDGKGLKPAVEWLERAASLGNTKAMLELGEAYQFGKKLGLKWDMKKAAYWYEKAAVAGNADAQVLLAVCYALGSGKKKDPVKCNEWYEKAAAQGHYYARIQLIGQKKYNGPETLESLVVQLIVASEQGDSMAQFRLGVCYENGKGVPKDLKKALEWYLKSADTGNMSSQFNSGLFYDNGWGCIKDHEKAIYWFMKAAEQGHAKAQNSIGNCYDTGRGLPKDSLKAAEWFRRSAEQNHSTAQSNLGLLYYYGRGVAKDFSQAAYWFTKAAEQGFARSQYMLGQCYMNGDGVDADNKTAVEYYRLAAESKRSDAQYMMGFCYENGAGIEKDMKTAIEWYKKSADQRYKLAIEAMNRINTDTQVHINEKPSSTNDVVQVQQHNLSRLAQPTLRQYLESIDMIKYLDVLEKEEIDYPALQLVNDEDLRGLGIPLGSRRKILAGIRKGHTVTESTKETTTSALHYVPDPTYEYDIFLSHKQANGADLAHSIKLQLLSLRPDLRIFLDVDDLNQVHKLEELVRASKNFLLLVTEGVLDRPFVQKECRTALREKKNIILVHDERNCSFPQSMGVPEDIQEILSPLAIPYYRAKVFRDSSIRMILEKLK